MIDALVIFAIVFIGLWIWNKFIKPKDGIDESSSASAELDPTPIASPEVIRSRAEMFKISTLKNKAWKYGAAGGLIGVVVGLWGIGFLSEVIADWQSGGQGGASGLFFIGMYLTFTPYIAVGLIVGGFVGSLRIRRYRELPEEPSFFIRCVIYSAVAGFIVGGLPFLAIFGIAYFDK